MAKEQALVPELVNIAVELDKGDVADIMVAAHEAHIKENIQSCWQTNEELQAKSKELYEQVNNQIKAAANERGKKTAERLQKIAKECGCSNVTVSIGGVALTDNGVQCNINVNGSGSDPQFTCLVVLKTKPVQALKKLYNEQLKTKEQIAQNNKDWLSWRRKLDDIGSSERAARAMLAMERLNKTAEGRALVQRLSGNVANSIKLLGVN